MIPSARPIFGDEEKAAVFAVIDSGQLVSGPRISAFEEYFAAWSGAQFAVATASGVAALHIALLASGVGPCDEVITPAYGLQTSADAILYAGARPVFADIDRDYLTIDPADIQKRITARTKAILPVHMYGQPCEMDAIAEIARRYGLAIIEDAFQAQGTRYQGQPVGSWGTACYSFSANRSITTIRGGIITTNDPRVAERARSIRDQQTPAHYLREVLGYSFRMTDMEAAVGLVQLSKLDGWNARRRENAGYLSGRLDGSGAARLLPVRANSDHAFSHFPVKVNRRETVAAHLRDQGIGVELFCPTPIYRRPFFRSLSACDRLPAAEEASRQSLALPVHPSLTRADLDRIADAVMAL
jgi:dTDP-4-amino-4,6-dideoxygalactose transaminase